MLIAVAKPDPDRKTMLPETMRAWSDRVFCVRLFTKLLKLRFSQEKEKENDPRYCYFANIFIRCNFRSSGCSAVRFGPIGDNSNDSHPLLNKYLCSIV